MDQTDTQPASASNKDVIVDGSTPSLSEGSTDPEDLVFLTGNQDKEVTILLIHGAGASATDWNLVVPNLTSYHLLIPSLFVEPSLRLTRRTRSSPQADKSKPPGTQRWDSCFALHLAQLVRKYAKGGRAHIVGLSFGACLAVKLIAAYPDLCLSLYASGLPTMVQTTLPSILRPIGTGVFCTAHAISRGLGAKMTSKFLDGEVDVGTGFWDGKGGGSTLEMNAILAETFIAGQQERKYVDRMAKLKKPTGEDMRREKLRIRLVAATRRTRWTPTSDSTETAIEIAQMLLAEEDDLDTDNSTLEEIVDCRVYEECILATVQDTEFPVTGLSEKWKFPSSPVLVE